MSKPITKPNAPTVWRVGGWVFTYQRGAVSALTPLGEPWETQPAYSVGHANTIVREWRKTLGLPVSPRNPKPRAIYSPKRRRWIAS